VVRKRGEKEEEREKGRFETLAPVLSAQ